MSGSKDKKQKNPPSMEQTKKPRTTRSGNYEDAGKTGNTNNAEAGKTKVSNFIYFFENIQKHLRPEFLVVTWQFGIQYLEFNMAAMLIV